MIEIEFKSKSTASSQNDDKDLVYSKQIIAALKSKVKEHNASFADKVSLAQLKELYISGAKEQIGSFTSNESGWARVNMFLRMTGEVYSIAKEAKEQADKHSQTVMDFSCLLKPTEQDFVSAVEDIQKYSLAFDFGDISNLYLSEPEPFSVYFHKFL